MAVATDRLELTGLVATVSSIGRAAPVSIRECIPSTARDRGRKAQPAHRAICGGECIITTAPRVGSKVSTTILVVCAVVRTDPASIRTSIPQVALTCGVAHSSGLDRVRPARVRQSRKWRAVALNAAAWRAAAAVAQREVGATGNRVASLWIEVRRRIPRGGRRRTEDARGRRIGCRGACELRVGRVLGRKGREGGTLLALPNASLAEKLGRDLEAIEFGDTGHVGEGVNRTVGMVGSWGKRKEKKKVECE